MAYEVQLGKEGKKEGEGADKGAKIIFSLSQKGQKMQTEKLENFDKFGQKVS